MKEQFDRYVKVIGLTETLTSRVLAFHEFCRTVCPEEIEHIFVTDYITKEGGRVYDSVWFFSRTFAMEAKEFALKEDYDIAGITPPLEYMQMEKQDYDLGKATDKPRMVLKVNFGRGIGGISGLLKASQGNCDFLWQLMRDYFIPRIKPNA